MPRLGIQFEKPPAGVQAVLDRYVYALIRRKAAARRPLRDNPGAERRLAPRAEISEGDRLAAFWSAERPRGVLAQARPSSQGAPIKILDISTTGCALACDEGCPIQAGQRIRLQLKAEALDIEVTGKVLYRV